MTEGQKTVTPAILGSNERLRIIVLGYFVRGPLGGMVSNKLQYLLGLMQLGHEVYFLEDSDDYPACYDPERNCTDTDPRYGLQFTERTMARAGFGDRWAYYDAHNACWHGPCGERMVEICATADLLLDIAGVTPLRDWVTNIPVRALIDLDPVFTQIRHLTDTTARARALQHTTFFSVGENIGLPSASIPDDGLPWQATRQPVVLSEMPVTPGPEDGKFTTIMLWDSYPAREYGGVQYGMKADSFEPYMDLPQRTDANFELAIGNASAPRELLQSNGWHLRDPREPTKDPWTYRHYLQQSKAEFSVAKHGYILAHTGWFSERSVAYLASGRPVVVQDAGFTDWLNTGAGVLAFTTPLEAIAAIDEVNSLYPFHCQAARDIAEEYFDAGKVLARLIERCMSV